MHPRPPPLPLLLHPPPPLLSLGWDSDPICTTLAHLRLLIQRTVPCCCLPPALSPPLDHCHCPPSLLCCAESPFIGLLCHEVEIQFPRLPVPLPFRGRRGKKRKNADMKHNSTVLRGVSPAEAAAAFEAEHSNDSRCGFSESACSKR